MKRLLLVAIAVLMMVPVVNAGRKTKKAGKIKNDVYTDAQFPFQMTMHDNWKPSIKKDKEKLRLTLMQNNYAIPNQFVAVPDYAKIPKVSVYVDTTSMHLHTFLDSLLSDDYKSDQKSDILKEFEILQRTDILQGDVLAKGRGRIEIDGESGVLWQGQAKYRQQVSTSAGSTAVKVVRDSYGGAIFVVKHHDHIYLFHLIAEWPYFESVLSEVTPVITSLKWTDIEAEEE